MIVISGALVLVALVLLIIGVVGPDLTFVYASIAVSLVSLVFLVIGILQRRGESAPAAEATPQAAPAADDESAGITTVLPTQSGRAAAEPPAPVADTVDEELETGGTVLIVEGRPRYHVEGCRYLNNKTAEKIDVLDAREEGFSPCGVCKPDDALEALQDEPVLEEEPLVEEEPVQEQEPVVEEDVPGVEVPPARKKAPAKKAARKAPAKKAAATRAVPVKAPSRSASTAKAAATAATPAAAAAKKTGSVVVIPDRGKFHRAECRYVRDVEGAEAMSKTAASRQGYAACGVCKP